MYTTAGSELRQNLSMVAACVAIGVLVACTGVPTIAGPGEPTQDPTLEPLVLSIVPSDVSLEPGTSIAFRAEFRNGLGSIVQDTVEWQASGGTISDDGVFFAANARGHYRIIANRKNGKLKGKALADTATVEVMDDSAAGALTIDVEPSNVVIAPSDSVQFYASVWDDRGRHVPALIEWQGEGGVISAEGTYVAGLETGSYRVIASANQGVSDTAIVEVSAEPPPEATSIVVTPANATVLLGETVQFSAVLVDGAGDVIGGTVEWAASGGSVSQAGLYAAGTSPGQFQVVASRDGLADTASVSIEEAPVASVDLTPGSMSLGIDQTGQFSAIPRDAGGNALDRAVQWDSSDRSVADVDATGWVIGLRDGFATVTAASGGVVVSASVTVTAEADTSSIRVDAGADTVVSVGQELRLDATVESSPDVDSRFLFWSKIEGPGSVSFAERMFEASFETGDVSEWTGDGGADHSGGGYVTSQRGHSGRFTWRAYNDPALTPPMNYSAKLLRWRFDQSSAYYSAWYYWPTDYVVADLADHYVNIFQFKEEASPYDPTWVVAVKQSTFEGGDDAIVIHDWHNAQITRPGVQVPKGRWFQLVAYLKTGFQDGEITLWLDGVPIYQRANLNTLGLSGAPNLMWGVGNYGSAGVGRYVDVDDTSVTPMAAATLRPRVRFSEPGTYVLRLTASDGVIAASDYITVTVQ